MTLVALELPDDVRDWPSWMEQQLVSLSTRELVQQLELIGGTANEPVPAIDSVMGDRRQALLEEGLRVLDESQLRAIVRHPRLLLSMQELVLLHGGPYWRTVERTEDHARLIAQQWQNLAAELDGQPAAVVTKQETMRPESGVTQSIVPLTRTTVSARRHWLIGLAALAAATLFVIYYPIFPSPEGRFFAARDIRDSQLVGKDYLRLLASRIQKDWKSDIDDKGAFEQQLVELRDSCEVLLASDLHQLDSILAADLKKRCQNWQTEFSKHIAELASGTPLADVQAKSNTLVDRLTQAITNLAV